MPKRKKRPKPGKPPIHPPVTVWETGETYETFTEAGDSVGCSRWGVMRVCEGVQPHTHGFHFFYDPTANGFDWSGDDIEWLVK